MPFNERSYSEPGFVVNCVPMNPSTIPGIFFLVFLLLNASCSSALTAADRLHLQLKTRDYHGIYREGSANLWAKGSEEDFARNLDKINSRLGSIKEISFLDIGQPFGGDVAGEMKIYTTAFELKGEKDRCYEIVIWDMSKGYAKLSLYECQFPGDAVLK